jgi:hypothetical protein
MNPFRVVWLHEARVELAELWIVSPNPRAVRDSADAIDAALSATCGTCGEHVREGLYKFVHGPLYVLYSVRTDEQVVEVAWVRFLAE